MAHTTCAYKPITVSDAAFLYGVAQNWKHGHSPEAKSELVAKAISLGYNLPATYAADMLTELIFEKLAGVGYAQHISKELTRTGEHG